MNDQLNPVFKDICNNLIKDRGYGLCKHRENDFHRCWVICKLNKKECIGGKNNCLNYEGKESK